MSNRGLEEARGLDLDDELGFEEGLRFEEVLAFEDEPLLDESVGFVVLGLFLMESLLAVADLLTLAFPLSLGGDLLKSPKKPPEDFLTGGFVPFLRVTPRLRVLLFFFFGVDLCVKLLANFALSGPGGAIKNQNQLFHTHSSTNAKTQKQQ